VRNEVATNNDADAVHMAAALKQARVAARRGEVPVGAIVLAADGRVLARAHNRRETGADPTAHAELIALRRAARRVGAWRLTGATLVVTLEPCPMCAGAAVNARIARIVYGAVDPKAGAVESLFRIADDPRLNHRISVRGGVLSDRCAEILSSFFRERRAYKKIDRPEATILG
jgi:tRNA(adenine34) deaminase